MLYSKGLKEVTSIYKGNKAIITIYRGVRIIWSSILNCYTSFGIILKFGLITIVGKILIDMAQKVTKDTLTSINQDWAGNGKNIDIKNGDQIIRTVDNPFNATSDNLPLVVWIFKNGLKIILLLLMVFMI